MIELPEAAVLAKQSNEIIRGQRIRDVIAARSPHKFAWYFGDPQEYAGLLTGKVIGEAASHGGQVEIAAGDVRVLFSDGVNLRYLGPGQKPPDKHQLLLQFDDGSCLVGSVQMYGGLSVFPEALNDNKYYLVAKEKPSPLTDRFDEAYFDSLFDEDTAKLSLKAFLATDRGYPASATAFCRISCSTRRCIRRRRLERCPLPTAGCCSIHSKPRFRRWWQVAAEIRRTTSLVRREHTEAG